MIKDPETLLGKKVRFTSPAIGRRDTINHNPALTEGIVVSITYEEREMVHDIYLDNGDRVCTYWEYDAKILDDNSPDSFNAYTGDVKNLIGKEVKGIGKKYSVGGIVKNVKFKKGRLNIELENRACETRHGDNYVTGNMKLLVKGAVKGKLL